MANNDDMKTAAVAAFPEGFGGVLKIMPEEGSAIYVDGRRNPPRIFDDGCEDAPADCLWRGTENILKRALKSERSFESVFISGQIGVAGDISVMARLSYKDQT